MKFITSFKGYRNTVIFIHGFRKSALTWNTTESNKAINIADIINKTANILLVQLQDEDYMKPVPQISDEILYRLPPELKEVSKSRAMILVGHSLGTVYAIQLATRWPSHFQRLLLLEPVIPGPGYLAKLKEQAAADPTDTVLAAKVANHDSLPNGLKLDNNTIVRIHINLGSEGHADSTTSNLEHLYQMVNHNARSRLVVHYKVGHMIHYAVPHIVIDAIRELLHADRH